MVLVPKEKLQQLLDYSQKCAAFANLCIERVSLLEAYKADADVVMKGAAEQIVLLKDEVEAEKKKQNYIIPGATLVIGLVLGFLVTK